MHNAHLNSSSAYDQTTYFHPTFFSRLNLWHSMADIKNIVLMCC